jgi:hypothetical protein
LRRFFYLVSLGWGVTDVGILLLAYVTFSDVIADILAIAGEITDVFYWILLL